MQFQVKYKCRMCGEEISVPNTYEMTQDEASKLVNKAIIHDDVIGAKFGLATKYIHNCSDGSVGITDLQGIKHLSVINTLLPNTTGKKPWYKKIFKG